VPPSTRAARAVLGKLWGESELTAYIAERNQAAERRILHGFRPVDSKGRPIRLLIVQNAKAFNPHKWGR
jgi:hypothetical protein